MSKRAEEAALKAYPKEEGKVWSSAFGMFEFDKAAPERTGYQKGYEQAEKDLGWHSVDECLPPIDEEVIVLRDEFLGKDLPSASLISFAHRPNPEGRDLKSLDTGEVKHYETITYDGWNIPGVKYWMPCPELKEEQK